MNPHRRAIGVWAPAGLGLVRPAAADTDAAAFDPRVRPDAIDIPALRAVTPPFAHAFSAFGLAEGETL